MKQTNDRRDRAPRGETGSGNDLASGWERRARGGRVRYEAGDNGSAPYLARDPDCRCGLGRGEIAEEPNQSLKGVFG